MIEVRNIEAINKGNLLASCDVRIVPWQFTFIGVKIFQKGDQRWISLPSKEKTDAYGATSYQPIGSFDTDSILKRFRNQVMPHIDAYLAANPTMEPEPVIVATDVFPF